MELIRFVHILGIVATFVFQDTQIITCCVAATIPFSLYRAMSQPLDVSRLLMAVIFVGSALALLVKTMPYGFGQATMLTAMALIMLGEPAPDGPRHKLATAALLFLSGYAVVSLIFLGHTVDTIFLHSKNYLSVLGLVFFFAAQSEWETSGRGGQLWLSVPAIGLCLLSLSVGGLLGAVGLVLYLVARRFGTAKLAVAALGLVITLYAITAFLNLEGYFQQLSLFIPREGSWGVLFTGLTDRLSALVAGEGGGDRLEIWSVYLNQLSPISWLTGLPLHELLRQSLHNSYLTMHMNFGVLAMALLAAWVMVAARARLSPAVIILFGLLALRAFVDSFLFSGGYFDGLILLSLRLYERPRAWVQERSPPITAAQGAS